MKLILGIMKSITSLNIEINNETNKKRITFFGAYERFHPKYMKEIFPIRKGIIPIKKGIIPIFVKVFIPIMNKKLNIIYKIRKG